MTIGASDVDEDIIDGTQVKGKNNNKNKKKGDESRGEEKASKIPCKYSVFCFF